MCGILCEICSKDTCKITTQDEELLHRIRNRGPNCMQTAVINPSTDTTVSFTGSVLWMQGLQLTPQPLDDDKGILLYNGDIFDDTWSSDASDTQTIMNKLNNRNVDITTEDHVLKVFKSLKGPFSIIYYDKYTHNLYFSKDRIGRSTLLFYKKKHSIVISSILGRNYKCVEVPATDIYCLNISTWKLKIFPWNEYQTSQELDLDPWLENLKSRESLPFHNFIIDFDSMNIWDSDKIVDYVESIAKQTQCKLKILEKLMNNAALSKVVCDVTELLEKSIKIRLKRQPNMCKDCLDSEVKECKHCTVGILFSGGLDCTILALLANKYLPVEQPIDLINVAFQKFESSTFNVPDRITGKQSYEELQRICPVRNWIFREVDVTRDELKQYQITKIADLIYPRQTILDESLGSALWFAARGKDKNTTSPCRLLLLGSGADELFGGYTRHRNAYKRQGWTGLTRELLLDWKRISFRNLSRDNRVICDHGRQPRMPYLDEDFTEFVLKLKPWFKCIPSEHLGPGIGDKLLLRLIAYNLGLTEAATLPKRALQFGSRIANKKEKGSDISATFA